MTATIAGGCLNPVLLRGYYQRIDADTGELLALFGSPERPDGILRVACKDRRASRCPTCARLCQRDAYQLLACGLRGGKSVPAGIGTHPAVMVTLTAPSFGAVHGNRDHGRPCRCGRRHAPLDPKVGTALYPDRYRYTEQVIWNHLAPELWKRTVQAIRRRLAKALGVPRSRLSQIINVRFARVAEFQCRGVVHYHAIIRIDGPSGHHTAPPPACTSELLKNVVTAAAQAASVPAPDNAPSDARVVWGHQREVVPLDQQTCTAAAGYIAKYATKATEAVTGGAPIARLRSADELEELDVPEQARRLITAAWGAGERAGLAGLKRWAHQFGYGGHPLTKSHQYSVTFAALRAARATWHEEPNAGRQIIVRAKLTYAGRGRPDRHPGETSTMQR